MHEHTIGTIEHNGKVYEIDWPFDIDDESKRDDVALVFVNDRELADFVHPDWMSGRRLDNAEEIMSLAKQYIEAGEFDD